MAFGRISSIASSTKGAKLYAGICNRVEMDKLSESNYMRFFYFREVER